MFVTKHDIEDGDFSTCLPEIIDALYSLAMLTEGYGRRDVSFEPTDIFPGLGRFMSELAADLRQINVVLYNQKATQ